jgi:N,N'-diacetyllegionaminate synthase
VSQAIKIGDRMVGPGHQCLIVAELGVNTDGKVSQALEMVRAAAKAGADACKVQAFTAKSFCTDQAMYQGERQVDMFQRYELSVDDLTEIAHVCKQESVIFFGTPDSVEQAHILLALGASCLKVGSDDMVHEPLIDALSRMGVPLVVSTGMAEWREMREVVDKSRMGYMPYGLILMHCVSLYPTPAEKANLRRFRNDGYDVRMAGYSDHTDGIEAAIGSVWMGACIVEKHFTLDRSLPGPDHAFSADPVQFTEMVRRIREAEVMMGTGEIDPSDEEKAMRVIARRSIVAARAIMEGERITAPMLAYKRPGDGLMPGRYQEIIGKTARRSLKPDEQFKEGDWC